MYVSMSLIPSGELKAIPSAFADWMRGCINESNSLRGVERVILLPQLLLVLAPRINESNSLRGVESVKG